MRVCVLFNPRAGSAGQIAALREVLTSRRHVTVRELGPDDDLGRLVADAARGRFDLIAVAGGDGTVHSAVNGLAPDFPNTPLAVVPLGTGNDLCRTLAVPLDPKEAVGLWRSGRRRAIDVIRVEGDHPTYAVNVVTGGFSGRVAADLTAEVKEFWGPLAYLRGAAGPAADRTGYRVALRFDGGPPERLDVFNVVVANARTAGGGVPVAPLADPEDGLLDVVVVPAGDLLDLSVVAARLMAGDYQADELVLHRRARRLELESDPPMPLSIDGELAEGSRFTFSAVPRVLRVVTGPDYRPDPCGDPPDADDWDAGAAGRGSRLFGLVAALLVFLVRLPRVYAAGLAFAAAAAVGFALQAVSEVAGRWRELDRAAMVRMRDHATPELTQAALAITALGNGPVTTGVGAALVLLYAARRRYLDAATLLAVLVGCGLLEVLLKGLFEVARPEWVAHLVGAGGYSFPSGHALRSVGLYGGLAALLVARHPRSVWRWLAAVCLVLIAVAITLTRPYLGVHTPTDVIAGALAAAMWVSGCLIARGYAHHRFARRQAVNGEARSGAPPRGQL